MRVVKKSSVTRCFGKKTRCLVSLFTVLCGGVLALNLICPQCTKGPEELTREDSQQPGGPDQYWLHPPVKALLMSNHPSSTGNSNESGAPQNLREKNWALTWRESASNGSKLPLNAIEATEKATEGHGRVKYLVDSNLDPSQCTPKSKFGFMKTHKTGSSTVQNSLLRHGYHHRLNFILPAEGNYVNHPKRQYALYRPFRNEWLNRVPWHRDYIRNGLYNVAALHTKWNYTAYRSMLGSEAVFATLLRDPVVVFESQFAYYNMAKFWGMNISAFIESLSTDPSLKDKRDEMFRGMNQLSWDLGMMSKEINNASAIEDKIHALDQDFDLVMINEYMNESLVLLAHLLCLPLSTMAGLRLNQRKSNSKVKLSEKEVSILQRSSSSDERIYHFFHQRFRQKLEEFGVDKMKKSVAKLKSLQEANQKRCIFGIADKKALKGTKFAPFSHDVIAYKIRENDQECQLMGMNELSLISLIRKKQRREYYRLVLERLPR